MLIAISLFNCSSTRDDLDTICHIANEISNDSTLNKEEKTTSLFHKLNSLDLSSSSKKLLNDMAMMSEISYENFEDFAAENGVENWECESLKEIMQ